MYITFSNPLFLWFLFLIPLIIIAHYYFLKKSRSKAIIFSNIQALKRMSKGNVITANLTHLLFRCLIIIVLIIAATGATLWVMEERTEVNIVFALDSSASMTAQDMGSSRFDVSKSIISGLLNNLPRGSDYALIKFSGITMLEKAFTDERAEILLALEQTSISRIGGSDLGGAIITATNLFHLRPEGGKALIIISDGLSNRGAFITSSPLETIQYAQDNQVIIYAIAIGAEGGPIGFLPEYYEIPSMFDDELLIALSEGTNGEYYRVEKIEDVQEVINQIQLDTTRGYVNYNLFYWAFPALFILLIFEWIIANTIYRRVL